MSWVTVGVAAAGAIKGGMDAKEAKKKQAKHDAYRKEAIRMSPWTDIGDPGAGNFGNTSALSGALGGGLQGFAMGSQIKGMGGAAAGGGGGAQAAKLAEDQATQEAVAQGTSQIKKASPWEMRAMNYQQQDPSKMFG